MSRSISIEITESAEELKELLNDYRLKPVGCFELESNLYQTKVLMCPSDSFFIYAKAVPPNDL